ncbi:MAG: polysaccharide deacetylase family protein [Synergistaceae bacterium]|jgi:peptidoglycan/xylan/chitin deacetylase (PgdA/CDA1 family)|nr:polysaccharide deacetylase family protein [Synergistaceae bacterium]
MTFRQGQHGNRWRFPRGKFSGGGLLVAVVVAVSVCASLRACAEDLLKTEIIARFAEEKPRFWGMDLEGITTRLPTEEKILALTFDACDGRPDGYDQELIEFLIKNKIPATLFVSGQWIEAHKDVFSMLAANPLFEIGSHGMRHRPLSVTGRFAYNLRGTESVAAAFDEVEEGVSKIETLTGRRPAFFRAGGAHYDDVAVRLVKTLGCKIAGFSLNGDFGATASADQVEKTFRSARGGEIVLMHMNRPGSGTLPGLKRSLPFLRERDFRFVRLSECFTEKEAE